MDKSTTKQHKKLTCSTTGGYSMASRASRGKNIGTPDTPIGKYDMYVAKWLVGPAIRCTSTCKYM
jgi:hypothetical protein